MDRHEESTVLASLKLDGQNLFHSRSSVHLYNVTLSAKTSLMLGVHKAGFRREGHILYMKSAMK